MANPNFALIECEGQKVGLPSILAWAEDGKSIVASLMGFTHYAGLARYDVTTGKILEISTDVKAAFGNPFSKKTVRSPDGTKLAVVLNSRCAVLDAVSLAELASFPEVVTDVSWSHDSQLLAAISARTVHCWEASSGKEIAFLKLKGSKENARMVAFLNDSQEIIIGTDCGVIAWEFRNWSPMAHLVFPQDHTFWQHGLSPDKRVLLCLSDKGRLLQTDTNTWETGEFEAPKNVCDHNFAFSPDGRLAAIGCGSGTGTLLIWDMINTTPWLKWSKKHFEVGKILFSPDGTRVACMLNSIPFVLDFNEGAKSVSLREEELAARKNKPNEPQCLQMVGSDNRMDQKGSNYTPLNILPTKCQQCRFVDLDFVPQPYLLGKGIDTPVDMAPTEVGNFLVREHVRKVLEAVAPEQVDFYPTAHVKTKEPTPWLLAVPKHQLVIGSIKASIQRCPACGEPMSGHGTQHEEQYTTHNSPFDVFKSRNWISVREKAPDFANPTWRGYVDHRHAMSLHRDLYFSIRLYTLFKDLGYRGFYASLSFTPYEPSKYDLVWLEEQRRKITSLGLAPAGSIGDSAEWFENYLKTKGKKEPKNVDFASVEGENGLALPAAYKEFISRIGARTFRNVEGEEGFDVEILPPQDLRFGFQKFSKDEIEDAEKIDAVIFAATEHGDLLCFDVKKKNTDYPVYLYEYEMDDFEPFAPNFATCIKRLAGR